MRFLPRIKVVQENLDLAMVNIDKAMTKLLKDNFTGYLTFSFDPENEALMLIQNGKIPDQLFFHPEKILRGKEAKEEISDWISKSQGIVDIIELNQKAFDSVMALFYGDSYFGPLDSSYVLFPGLLDQIKDDKQEGCLAIEDNENSILIYIADGKPSSIYFKSYKIRKGTKEEILKFVTTHEVRLEFFTRPTKLIDDETRQQYLIEGKKETLHLQKIVEEGYIWFEDQHGNRYKKSQIKDLWEKYHLVL